METLALRSRTPQEFMNENGIAYIVATQICLGILVLIHIVLDLMSVIYYNKVEIITFG